MAIQLIDTVTPDIGLKTVGDKLNNNFTDPSNAASRLVTSSATDTTAGRLLKVGDFGLGEASPASRASTTFNGKGLIASRVEPDDPVNPSSFLSASIHASISANFGAGLVLDTLTNPRIYHYSLRQGVLSALREIYHTGNTIVDSNGFIKQA